MPECGDGVPGACFAYPRDEVNALEAQLEITKWELEQQTIYEGILWEEFKNGNN